MPPTKTPPKPKDAAGALVLFAKNLEEIRRWHRQATSNGQELGHIVQGELILGHVSTALALAMQGKEWTRPSESP